MLRRTNNRPVSRRQQLAQVRTDCLREDVPSYRNLIAATSDPDTIARLSNALAATRSELRFRTLHMLAELGSGRPNGR